jgi:hypothetical protein
MLNRIVQRICVNVMRKWSAVKQKLDTARGQSRTQLSHLDLEHRAFRRSRRHPCRSPTEWQRVAHRVLQAPRHA